MYSYRIERDRLSEVQVPTEALYGAQTQRASPAVWSGWRSWRLVARPWGPA